MADTVRFTMDNSLIKDALGNIDKSTLKDFEAQVRYITNALKSATNSIVAVSKQLDPTSGLYKAIFSVDKTQSSNARATMLSATAKLAEKYGYEPDFVHTITEEDEKTLSFFRKLKGTRAKQLAKDSLDGSISIEAAPTHKNKDRYLVNYRISESEYNEKVASLGSEKAAKAFYSKELSNKMSKAMSASRFDTREENIKNKEKEDAKREKEREKEREKGKEKDKEKSSKKGAISWHWIMAIIALLTGIFDVTRRVLTSVLENATKTKEQAVTARSLSLSPNDVRRYESQERAMGLKQGVFVGALNDIQSNLGDISNLNEKTLGELAKVLGSDVKQMVDIALGENNPAKAMELILNSYFERGRQGINSVGMQVGQLQAERELATALEKAGMANLAEVLRNMFYTNSNGIYAGQLGRNTAFSDYMNLTSHVTSSAIDQTVVSALGQEIEALRDRFARLKNTISDQFIRSLSELIDKINGSKVGKSDTEQADDYIIAANKNVAARDRMYARAEYFTASSDRLFKEAGIDFSTMNYGGLDINSASEFFSLLKSGQIRPYEVEKIYDEDFYKTYQKVMSFLYTPEGQEAMMFFNLAEESRALGDEAEKNRKGNLNKSTSVYSSVDALTAKVQQDVQDSYAKAYGSADTIETAGAYALRSMYEYAQFIDKSKSYGFTEDDFTKTFNKVAKASGIKVEDILDSKAGAGKLNDLIKTKFKWNKEDLKKYKGSAIRKAFEEKKMSLDDILMLAIAGLYDEGEYKKGYGFSEDVYEVFTKSLQSEFGTQNVDKATFALATEEAMKQYAELSGLMLNNNKGHLEFSKSSVEGTFKVVFVNEQGKELFSKDLTTTGASSISDKGSVYFDANGNITKVVTSAGANQATE